MVGKAAMIAGLILAAGVPATASADDPADGWDVQNVGQACRMVSTFEDNVTIGLIWTPETKDLEFLAFGDDWKKVAGQAGSSVPINLKFDGKVPHDDWTADHASVIPIGSSKVAVVADFGPTLATELANTVSSSQSVAVTVGGKRIGSYDLGGSPAAYQLLMRCGEQIAAR